MSRARFHVGFRMSTLRALEERPLSSGLERGEREPIHKRDLDTSGRVR
jgi:hypothetical protein